jgi:hypothetical protein
MLNYAGDLKIFLEGPAGTGKTTLGVHNLLDLYKRTNDGILVVVPQKTLAEPYYEAIRTQNSNEPDILTIGGLASKMVELYWPLISEDAGFVNPDLPPIFLNLETTQYFMAKIVQPLIEDDYFESVTISQNRLYTQIVDNLNKAALIGFPYQEISEKLQFSVVEQPEQTRIYADAQVAADKFRQYCLRNNLLDFSLMFEVFFTHLWPEGTLCREYLQREYKHLIFDNLEEARPVEQDIIREWLPDLESALLIYDTDGGYRFFLGADPISAISLRDHCDEHIELRDSYVAHPDLIKLGNKLGATLKRPIPVKRAPLSSEALSQVLEFENHRYYPDMLDWVAENVAGLVKNDGVPPNEIVVLAPFLSDALRYSLSEKLSHFGIPVRSHRPSRSLRDEPVSGAMLTLAKIAHPDWGIIPSKFEVAYMLVQVIEGLDLVRGQLLTEVIYQLVDGLPSMGSFEEINPEMQERITYTLGERFEQLRNWLNDYRQSGGDELDFFLGRLFGEVLSQPGYGFHTNKSAGGTISNLIDSIRNFRQVAGSGLFSKEKTLGREYIEMVQDGVIAAQYIRSWQDEEEDAVLLTPAYTFLMRNQSVEYQFWLDIGSSGWHERIFQPLTHPHVLNRNWPKDKYWSDVDEVEASKEALYRLTVGLIRRCRKKVFLGLSDLSESGYEYQGMLIKSFQRVLQKIVGGK